MEFRVLDEVVEIEENGLMLFAAEEDCRMLFDGCRIRDSKGNIHIVDRISCTMGSRPCLSAGDTRTTSGGCSATYSWTRRCSRWPIRRPSIDYRLMRWEAA